MRIRLEYNNTIICATEYINFDTHYKLYWFIRQVYNHVNAKVKLKPFIECFDKDSSDGFTLKLEDRGKYTTNEIIGIVEEAVNDTLSLVFEDKIYSLDSASQQYPLSVYLDTNERGYEYIEKVVYYKDSTVEDWKDITKIDEIVQYIVNKLKGSFILNEHYTIFGKLDNICILPILEIQYKGSEDQSEIFYHLVNATLNDLFHVDVSLTKKKTDKEIFKEYLVSSLSRVFILSGDTEVNTKYIYDNGEYTIGISIQSDNEVLDETELPIKVSNDKYWDLVFDELHDYLVMIANKYPDKRLRALISQIDINGDILSRITCYRREFGWSIFS